jgi:selenocysteine-specific elongation factor
VPRGHQGAILPEDEALYDTMITEYYEAAYQPPFLQELRCRTPKNDKRVRELANLAAYRGQLVRVADGLWIHPERWKELTEIVSGAIRERGELTVSEIRTLLNSSRKYVVPLAEYLDAVGITRRVGDRRTLGPDAPGD